MGLSATAYLLGAVVGALVFGYATDRLGRKKLFTWTLLLYLVATAATAFSWNFFSYALFRAPTGARERFPEPRLSRRARREAKRAAALVGPDPSAAAAAKARPMVRTSVIREASGRISHPYIADCTGNAI